MTKAKSKSKTISLKRLAQQVIQDQVFSNIIEVGRPQRRMDCQNMIRPCPFVGCAYHLFLEIKDSGSIQYNFPDLQLEDLEYSCALDVVDCEGVLTLDRVGALLNISRERVRQIEERALAKILNSPECANFRELVEQGLLLSEGGYLK